jgi:hypothetical protein
MILGFLLWIGILLSSQTLKAMDLTEFGAIGFTLPSFQTGSDPSIQITPEFSWGGGISMGFRIFERIDVEPALYVLPRSFSVTSNITPRSDYTFMTLQVPLLLRYWFSESLSLGLGPYWVHGMGNVTLSQGSSSGGIGYDNLSWSREDFGLAGSFRIRLPINELMSIVLDERVLWGISNLDQSGTQNLRLRDLQSWGGVSFNL